MFVSVLVVRGLLAELRQRGYDADPWLHEAGIDQGVIGNLHAEVDVDTWDRLLHRASFTLRDPALGLTIGFGNSEGMLQILGYMLWSSSSLAEAFELCQRYSALIVDDLRLELVHVGSQTHFRFGFHNNASRESLRFGEDLISAVALRLGKHHVPDGMQCELRLQQEEPAHRARFEEHFGHRITFGCQHSELVFERSLLLQVQPHADPQMVEALAATADKFLRIRRGVSFTDRVRLVLSQMNGLPEIEAGQVAARLGMSTRMLRRRLHPEGASLRQLADESLRRAACLSLGNPNTSVKDVAERLGYSEPSAFHRAFKRWTGMTPSEYQRSSERLEVPVLP
jgi:AraC-like DNA-binding protein